MKDFFKISPHKAFGLISTVGLIASIIAGIVSLTTPVITDNKDIKERIEQLDDIKESLANLEGYVLSPRINDPEYPEIV